MRTRSPWPFVVGPRLCQRPLRVRRRCEVSIGNLPESSPNPIGDGRVGQTLAFSGALSIDIHARHCGRNSNIGRSKCKMQRLHLGSLGTANRAMWTAQKRPASVAAGRDSSITGIQVVGVLRIGGLSCPTQDGAPNLFTLRRREAPTKAGPPKRWTRRRPQPIRIWGMRGTRGRTPAPPGFRRSVETGSPPRQ